MFMSRKYPVGLRLGAVVALTEEEIRKVANGDSSPIVERINNKEIGFGLDSYIPGPWIEESRELPEAVKRVLKDEDGHYSDIELDISGAKLP